MSTKNFLQAAPALVIAMLGTSVAADARADDAVSPTSTTPDEPRRPLVWHAGQDTGSTPGVTQSVLSPRTHAEERAFAFLLDPSTPSKGDVGLEYRIGLASGVAADRPLPSTVAASGAEHALTLGYGVTDRIAPFAQVSVLEPATGSGNPLATGRVGARFQLTRPDRNFRMTVATAAFRDFDGTFGGYARLAASYDIERLRIAGNLHAEHAFHQGRDPVDVLVLAGASYRVLDEFRVGIEYVGQDLEEAFDDQTQAEGGARNFVGPNVALDVVHDVVQLVAGAAVGVDRKSPPVVGSLAMLMTF